MKKSICSWIVIPVFYAAAISLSMYSAAKAVETSSAQHMPIKIAAGILQKPGAIAWASDNKTIAFLSDSLQLYDISTGRTKNISISGISFIAAGPQNMLYFLYDEGSVRKLGGLDIGTFERKEIPIEQQPDGVIALSDNRGLLLITVSLTQKRLWAELSYTASLLDIKASRAKIIYQTQRTIQGKINTSDYQSGWLWAPLRPFETEILAMEYVKPPVVMPYLKIRLADYVTGKIRDAGRIEPLNMSTPVSWSPDGNRFAFPDMQGRLRIYEIKESLQNSPADSEHISGYYPSWNPKGSQIFFGGYITNSDGSGAEKLIDEGQNSMGIWSPDGGMLAIADRGGLYLIHNFRASRIPPDRIYSPDFTKKRMLLKELLVDKLISDQEYDERYNRLMKKEE